MTYESRIYSDLIGYFKHPFLLLKGTPDS